MEKFDQETREKKAATTSQLLVIPPRTEAAKAPKLPASAAAARSSGAEAASSIASASAADPAFGSATPKRDKQCEPPLVISPTYVRPAKRLDGKQPQVKPLPGPTATATKMTDQEPGPAAQKRGLEEVGASQAAGSADLEGGGFVR